MAMANRYRWSEVFIRRAPNVFKVRPRYDESVLDWRPVQALAVTAAGQQFMMSGDTTVWVFLDGGVAAVNQEWPEMVDSDFFGDGFWVVGTSALRAVCGALDLIPPRRLGTEAATPSEEALGSAIRAQRTALPPGEQATLITSFSGARRLLKSGTA